MKNRILVVDDDLELCQVIVDTLRERDYDAFFVQNAEDALEKIMAHPPDLILLDLEIPQMGGFVLCQKLRENFKTKKLPLIFLTVRDSDFDRRTGMSLGANQYITKPFKRSHLLQEVETLLSQHAEQEDWIGPSNAHLQKAKEAVSFSKPLEQVSSESQPREPARIQKPETAYPKVEPQTPALPKQSEAVPIAKDLKGSSMNPPAGDRSLSPPSSQPSAPSVNLPPIPVPSPKGYAGPPAVGKVKGFETFESFRGVRISFLKRATEWMFRHKSIALPVAFAVVAILMWGSVTLYRKLSHLKEKVISQTQGEGATLAVNVMQAIPAPFQDILSAVGTVAGGAEIELRFQTEGNIRSINFREGDPVRDGQVIAQLDQTQVLIKLERARSEFFRYEKLYALGGVSKDRLEEARVQYDYAKSELDKTVLRASQDGILGDKGVEVGEFVTPQKKVGTLVSLNTVLVRIGIIEKEIDKVFPGQLVLATVDTYPNVEFKGKVENISPLVQGQSKTLTVEARFPNDGKLLLPGMFARAKIAIYEKDNAISVPNDALEKTPEGYHLYVVGKDQKAEARTVEVSYVSLTHSVISNGLQAGEQIIVQRPQELKPGTPLKVIEVEKPVSEMGGAGAQ